ncbi:MAG: pyridoxamine 5'-phosphate oxidase family protein [Acidobacteriota bacterium]
MDVASFGEIEGEFNQLVERIVWCTVATTDRKGRLRSRLLHPIWETTSEAPKGWIMTGRNSLKSKHIAVNPYITLSYWDPQHEQAYIDCHAAWNDDVAEKKRIWDLLLSSPEPYGYDPVAFWEGPESPDCGLLELAPWRVEVSKLAEMMTGKPALVWRG